MFFSPAPLQEKDGVVTASGTAPRTLLHELHSGVAPQKTWSLWSTTLGALTTSPFFLEQSCMALNLFG